MGSIRSVFFRQWENKLAVNDVSLDVEAGEILGLLGANGAGKTTLVKILAGIIHPSSGEVSVLGQDPWRRKNEFRRNIALVMGQKAQLWWDLPAADCFLLLREIYQIPRPEYRESLDFLAEKLDVTDLLTTQIRRLSLGERMKMELIATLLHRPQVVFLDEPTIGLDISSQRAIRSFILEYRQTFKPAMIVTSHYMDDIRNLCRRIVILRRGASVYDGPLADVVSRYGTHKIVSAQVLPQADRESPSMPEVSPELGEVLEMTADTIQLKVHRDRTVEGAEFLLEHFNVQDLTIEEPDVASIIEALQVGSGDPRE